MLPRRYFRHASRLMGCVLLSVTLTVSWYTSGVIKPAKAGGRPPLAWQFVTLNVDKNECLNRARHALASQRLGKIQRKEYYVSMTNFNDSVDIICMKIGKRKTIAFIAATSSKSDGFRWANGFTVYMRDLVNNNGPYPYE